MATKITEMIPIGYIHNAFSQKFGIPRQSGLTKLTKSYITFASEFQNPDCIRGIEQYSHLWLLWNFSENPQGKWSPTVRPPRLGGNQHVGVFATRSPFRPNSIGLSSVKLEAVYLSYEQFLTSEDGKDALTGVYANQKQVLKGPILVVSGADLMDGTPLFDIKPYLPFTDSHPEAEGGFSQTGLQHRLKVDIDSLYKSLHFSSESLASCIEQQVPDAHADSTFSATEIDEIVELLSLDPRPAYHNDPERIYGMQYKNKEIHFLVVEDTVFLV